MKRIVGRWYKKNLNDITILLSFLSICGLSLGLLAQVRRSSSAQDTLSISDFMAYIHPFLISRGVERIVYLMDTLSPEKIIQVLHRVVNSDEWALTQDDKLKLIVHLGRVQKDEIVQGMIFEFLRQYSSLLEKYQPIFYTLAQSPVYINDIPTVLSWMKMNDPDMFLNKIDEAIAYSIDQNNVAVLKTLLSFVPFSTEKAQEFLWQVVTQEKDPLFLDVLMQYAIDINNERKIHTPLMIAVEKHNIPLIKKLLSLGADPNKVVDNATGSALQIALVKENKGGPKVRDYVAIEQLLRLKGARERTP